MFFDDSIPNGMKKAGKVYLATVPEILRHKENWGAIRYHYPYDCEVVVYSSEKSNNVYGKYSFLTLGNTMFYEKDGSNRATELVIK